MFVSCMYLDGGMGGGGWLLTSFFSIIYILGLVCYKHTIHVMETASSKCVAVTKRYSAARHEPPIFKLPLYTRRASKLVKFGIKILFAD